MKNTLIKALTSIWRFFFKPNEQDELFPRFLIVSTTALGDTLWATPAIKSLRDSLPHAYIAVLTSAIGEQVLRGNPHIDDIFVIRKSTIGSLLKLFFKIRERQIQTALIFHTSQRPILPYCVLIGASEIIGQEKLNKGLDFLLTKQLPLKPVHEIERRLQLLPEPRMAAKNLELFVTEEDNYEAAAYLDKFNIPPYVPLIGIHPGSKDAFKRWPAEHFIELALKLKDQLGCQIFLSGNASEKDLLEEIAKAVPGAIICDQLPLRIFASLLKKMALFISNDTGPMHVAFAMHTKTVALFTPTDPRLCGPYLAPNVHVIRKPVTCSPCLRKKCLEPFCLLQISPKEVFEASLKLFYA